MSDPDAVVVGSGPNGLAAAVTLAEAGWSVLVVEGQDVAGGGARTAALTEPGFAHDVCASVHPMVAASPFFRHLALDIRLVTPAVSFAHPLPGPGTEAAVAWRSLEDTAAGLGPDAAAYLQLMEPLCDRVDDLVASFLDPPPSLSRLPTHPGGAARLLERALRSSVATDGFQGSAAPALLAGAAAHAAHPLRAPVTRALGLFLTTLAHTTGWPVIEGGSGALVSAMVGRLQAAGGRLETGRWIRQLDELPAAPVLLLDVGPQQLADLAGPSLPLADRLAIRAWRRGPGISKVDWALTEPVPWSAPACRQAVTIHLGGTAQEIAASEREVAAGRHPTSPYCIVVQPTVVDPTRAPAGRHTLWAYCHVPSGSTFDMVSRIEAQIERFAPGFADTVLARHSSTAAQLGRYNPNCPGGDIGGGELSVRRIMGGPLPHRPPYRTGVPGLYLCSASTPPGPGVHGMCGLHAASAVLDDERSGRLARRRRD